VLAELIVEDGLHEIRIQDLLTGLARCYVFFR
jgi:hypothetical protein